MTSGTPDIEKAHKAWLQTWSSKDINAILDLWDQDDVQSYYLPADQHIPLVGKDAVATYVTTDCQRYDSIFHRAENLHLRQLSPSIGLTFYELNWTHVDDVGPIGGRCRVTGMWRQGDDDHWRLFHYAEAPLAPLLELQAYYESIAADGLDNIPPRSAG